MSPVRSCTVAFLSELETRFRTRSANFNEKINIHGAGRFTSDVTKLTKTNFEILNVLELYSGFCNINFGQSPDIRQKTCFECVGVPAELEALFALIFGN